MSRREIDDDFHANEDEDEDHEDENEEEQEEEEDFLIPRKLISILRPRKTSKDDKSVTRPVLVLIYG